MQMECRLLTAGKQIKNSHSNSHSILDLIQNNGIGTIRHLTAYFDSSIDGTGARCSHWGLSGQEISGLEKSDVKVRKWSHGELALKVSDSPT